MHNDPSQFLKNVLRIYSQSTDLKALLQGTAEWTFTPTMKRAKKNKRITHEKAKTFKRSFQPQIENVLTVISLNTYSASLSNRSRLFFSGFFPEISKIIVIPISCNKGCIPSLFFLLTLMRLRSMRTLIPLSASTYTHLGSS